MLNEGSFDYDWKDRKIFSPLPQPAAGASFGRQKIDPERKLLLVTYHLDPDNVSLGNNIVSISVTHQVAHTLRQLKVEKVELHITQK